MQREFGTLGWPVASHLFERYRIGPVPEVLSGNDYWLDPEASERFEATMSRELAALGLLDGDGLREDFHDALLTSALPGEAYFGWVQSHEAGQYAVQLARSGRDAVVLLRRENWVSFTRIEAEDLARGFLRQLPEFGFNQTAKAISLPERDAPWDRRGADSDEPPANRTAMRLRDLLRMPRYGAGQLHAVKTRGNDRQRAAEPLSYIDNTDGRWLTQFLPGKPGERHVVAVPGHPGRIHEKLGELLGQV